MNFIYEGGPIFMVPLLIFLIIIIFLFGRGLKKNTPKNRKIISEIGIFSFVFGVLGFVIGILSSLDDIARVIEISPQVLAGGFKVGLIAPTFGLLIFLIGKLLTIILASLEKE